MSYYQKPISKSCTKVILEQMENSFCKIEGKDKKFGIGFFCYIKAQNNNIPVLITKDDINISEYNTIKICLNGIHTEIKLGDIIYKNKKDKILIMEMEDKVNHPIKFLEFDDRLYGKAPEQLYHKELIYIIQYTNQDNILVSYSMINNMNKNELIYNSDINLKAKYSLIFNLSNNKLIGIHSNKINRYNKGFLFKFNIDRFNYKYRFKNFKNEIDLVIKIRQKDINKKVYFLDNEYYDFEEEEYKNKHDNLKELDKSNTELYIDGIVEEYKKYFIPKEEKEYNIKLKFKINLIDCSYMFAGCKNIIKIDLTNFNTKYVIKMIGMFYGCLNMKYINLFSFKTENVNDMSFMFYQCQYLKYLDLSSFDTEKVTNMSFIFSQCKNLKKLNIF